MKISRAIFAVSAVSMGVAFAACDTPDPQGRFDEFGKNTEEFRNLNNATNNEPNNAVQVDFSGRYLLAITTPLLATPLLFDTTVEVDADFKVKFSFQPLKTDTDPTMASAPRTDARAPIGDPIVVEDVQLNPDGSFVVDLVDAAVAGSANPISGGDIVATLQLTGYVTSATSFCGSVSGGATEPTPVALDGSTFGTVLIEVDDLTLITPSGKCEAGVIPVDDAGMDAGTDADAGDVGPAPKVRCPENVAGDYLLTFKATVQQERTQVKMTVVESDDANLCFTGEILSLTSGTKIGDVEYFREEDGELKVLVPNFTIPPGATPLLPDGGNSRLELTASHWTSEGSCGELFFSIVGLPVTSDGEFAAIRENSTKFTVTDSTTLATCSAIEPVENCGLDNYAGTYNLKFITEATAGAGGNPTVVSMELGTHPLTCLSGSWVSKTSGDTLATVQYAELSGTDQIALTIRNFVIPADPTNPIAFLRNGGLADATLTSTQSVPGTDMCGTMAFALIEPIAINSAATFAASTEADPATAACPE